jgi:outer membrane protein TolC
MNRIFNPAIYILLFVCFAGSADAQVRNNDAGSGPADTSARVFSLQDLQQTVLRYHPIVKRAMLLSDEARAKVMEALGKFDPLIQAALNRKEYGETRYYNYWDSELKVPLWLAGADLKIGYDRTTGAYINPDKRTLPEGLTAVGISIPIGQGLLIDARRSALRQARLMQGYAEAEQISLINEVWYNAVKDYWNWFSAYSQANLLREGVLLAEARFRAISLQVQVGDRPPIDSVEASITVFDRQLQYEKYKLDLRNTRLILSTYLWNNNVDPLELPERAVPQDGNLLTAGIDESKLDSLMDLAQAHPDIRKLRNQVDRLAIERQYRLAQLQPRFAISGSLLSNRRDFGGFYDKKYDFNAGNYKVGLDLSLPLFLRAERGRVKQINIQQKQVGYDLQQTGREIQNNVLTAYNDLKTYETQLRIQAQSVLNQRLLLTGETQKFELGESTLFLINTRETKLIEMRVKQVEIITDLQKKLAELYYRSGLRVN